MKSRTATLLCVATFAAGGCQSEQRPGDTFDGDVAGVWVVNETSQDSCSDDGPEQAVSYYVVTQQGNDISFSIHPSTDSYSGKIQGNTVSWTAELPTDSGTTTSEFEGSVSNDGDEITGTAPWTWTNGTDTCTGTTSIVAHRCVQPTVSFAGAWAGDWASEANSIDGTFAAAVTQADYFLGGVITVEEIGMFDASLVGIVCGDEVTFGDIERVIVFDGHVTGNSFDSAEGQYNCGPSLSNDHGTWTAAKDEEASGTVTVGASHVIPHAFTGDLAFDGTHLWNVTNTSLQRFDAQGNMVETLSAPGSYPRGLAAKNGSLFVGDEFWGTGLIYELDADNAKILDAPDDVKITGLCHDGEHVWGIDSMSSICTIYRFDDNGALLKSFACPAVRAYGLACNAQRIWTASASVFDSTVHELDHDGVQQDSFTATDLSVRGLTVDGDDLWLADWGGTLSKYSTGGVPSGTLEMTLGFAETVKDIAVDGTDLFVVVSSFEDPKILRLSATDGGVLAEIQALGTSPAGLTFADGAMWSSDDVNDKIILHTGTSVFSSYPAFDVAYMTHDGQQLWCIDQNPDRIVSLDAQGAEASTIDWDKGALGGIAHFDDSLWVISNGASDTAADKLHRLSMSGEVLDTYAIAGSTLPRAIGLAHDGTNLWFLGSQLVPSETTLNRLDLPE